MAQDPISRILIRSRTNNKTSTVLILAEEMIRNVILITSPHKAEIGQGSADLVATVLNTSHHLLIKESKSAKIIEWLTKFINHMAI